MNNYVLIFQKNNLDLQNINICKLGSSKISISYKYKKKNHKPIFLQNFKKINS
jgi:hypothetical protein